MFGRWRLSICPHKPGSFDDPCLYWRRWRLSRVTTTAVYYNRNTSKMVAHLPSRALPLLATAACSAAHSAAAVARGAMGA